MSDAPHRNRHSEISIVHIAPPQITSGGDFVYRLAQPDAALGRIDGVTTASITNIISRRRELCVESDVLIIQLLGEPDLLPLLLERRRAGRPTVFEISDNFLNFQPSNPAAAFYENPESRACILQLISESDAVQTTVPALAELFSPYNARIAVFENQIEKPGSIEKPDGPLIVGWGGSVGHLEDIRAVAPALTEWLQRRHDVVLSIMADPTFMELFKNAPAERIRFTPPGTLDDFYSFVQTLHVGIAPIRDDEFNLCRSDVKFMEYASRGAVPVCADVPTYNRTLRNGETGLLFSNTEEMIGHLDSLADNPELRRSIAERAFEYIANERSERKAARKRLDFYASLLPEEHKPGSLTAERLATIPSLIRTPGSRHFMHSFSTQENHVYNGIVLQFGRGDFAAAERCYRAALAAEPDYFQARFYLGWLLLHRDLKAAEKELRAAIETEPSSCEARLKLARALAEQSKFGAAVETVRNVRRRWPKCASAFFAEAELESLKNKCSDKETKLLEQALEANPYFVPAAIRLGVRCFESGDFADAEVFFRRAVSIVPRFTPAISALASTLEQQGKEQESIDCLIRLLRVEPDSSPAAEGFLKIALNKYKSGDYESAAETLSRALDASPNQPDLLFWMIRVKERAHGEQAALPFRKRLLKADTAGKYKRAYENLPSVIE